MKDFRVAVVGGGIIGTAVAREATRRFPGAAITVFEKETQLGQHQTGHNSGVVHAGLYYTPGSIKAVLCRRGVGLLQDYVQERKIPFDACGKIVVARAPDELARLDEIHRRAGANGVPGLRLLSGAEIRDVEPHANGLGALHSPTTAIVDYVALTEAFGRDVEAAGGELRLATSVQSLQWAQDKVLIDSTHGQETEQSSFDLVIACAGLQSDRLTAREADSPRIIPFYGDYLRLIPERSHLVNGMIYPVPDPRYPFLGVHLTKMIDGSVTIGPNAFLSLGRELYRKFGMNFRDVLDIVGYSGFWKFSIRNMDAALKEIRGVLSPKAFVAEARQFVPELSKADVVSGGRGVRAQAMDRSGHLLDDFAIIRKGRLTEVRNAPSPGATASMAIAEHIVQVAAESAEVPLAGQP